MMKLQRLKNRLLSWLTGRIPLLAKRFVESYNPQEPSGPIPWTPVTKPLKECRVAIVTTAGVHHVDDVPFNMDDPDGDPTFRVIDANQPLPGLMITHDYYDHRDADRDINIVFPIERLGELEKEGVIGSLSAGHYSLMGHIINRHLVTLVETTAPAIARRLRNDGVDVVLLTPG